ncbi:hypothetical protein SAMN05444487_104140 [Marininema mesophilum]|uniref:Uncharacterized protein n=1 Tax=Marininema mesophilum TaxID=1048340 RepID=A0A1H2UL73_9BACL|nr:hypothetical protein [Marininema mesophilum]SDW56810.1 hypothetical protein SAMN05444487_104140 [Marininema mesophilum]
MQNVKRKVFTGALALLLAASVSAGASSKAFAAQDGKGKLPEKYIQGYLVKDGKKTPVYSDSNKQKSDSKIPMSAEDGTSEYAANYPTLSADPYAPAPQKGNTTTESAEIGNILYFDGEGSINSDKDGTITGKYYLEKKPDGNVEMGLYDPETLKLHPSPLNAVRIAIGEEEMVKKYGAAFAWSKAFDGTSKLKRETQFNLVKTSTADKAVTYNFKEDITHGVQTSDMFSFAFTVGYKFSVQEGVPGVAQATEEISSSLTETYQHNISVTDQKTTSESFTSPAVNNPDYKYPVYRGAGYQLKSTYTIIPGSGLSQLMKDFSELGDLAKKQYQYNDDEMYFPLTPGSHI